MSVYGGKNKRDRNEEFKSVTETWLKEEIDDKVKEWFLSKNGYSIVNLLNDEGVDDFDQAKSINTMLSHCGRYIFIT